MCESLCSTGSTSREAYFLSCSSLTEAPWSGTCAGDSAAAIACSDISEFVAMSLGETRHRRLQQFQGLLVVPEIARLRAAYTRFLPAVAEPLTPWKR